MTDELKKEEVVTSPDESSTGKNEQETKVEPKSEDGLKNVGEAQSSDESSEVQKLKEENENYKKMGLSYKKKYNDLLETQEVVEKPKEEEGYDDALKVVDSRIDEKLSKLDRKIELNQTIEQNSDFMEYADEIKEKVKDNPSMGWDDAYKVVKFDANQSKPAPRPEVQAPAVESAASSKSVDDANTGTIDPMAKDANGNYLYSTDELKELLPKTTIVE